MGILEDLTEITEAFGLLKPAAPPQKVYKEVKQPCAPIERHAVKRDRVDCCCPLLPVFIFKEVNCVNIFNGACEDWRPGGPCAAGHLL